MENLEKTVNLIAVPDEIEYISEWKEFVYPKGHLILDKTICGCGFTEYCLNNDIPTILCSPRKALLENKEKQHNSEDGQNKGLRRIYYFRNEEESIVYDFPFDMTEEEKKEKTQEIKDKISELSDVEKESYMTRLKINLTNYLKECSKSNEPFKIIVTYDSLHHILDVFKSYGIDPKSYAIVVDEFQSIFMDATFKATVELDFVNDLYDCENVLYLSATPMLEKYLGKLNYFKDLPMYKLKWPDSRIEHVKVERRITRNIGTVLKEWIDNYRKGVYPNKVLQDGTLKESKELVIFVNSVNTICHIIRRNGLKPEETNIICSDSTVNIGKLKKVGHKIGEIPVQGEAHKMFTLCTRTSYLGADFYSTCAYTIICSDCNIKTLTVDISLDLPQILGRQRLKENVFRNEVLFLYKARSKDEASINFTEEQSKANIDSKIKETERLLAGYEKMSEEEKLSWSTVAADVKNLYQKNYLGVSSRTGKATFNYLVKVAEERAFDVSRKEYQDDITIKRGIESIQGYNLDASDENKTSDALKDLFYEFKEKYESLPNSFEPRMRCIYDYHEQYPQLFKQFGDFISSFIPRSYENYINILGFDRMKANGFRELEIIREIENISNLEKAKESNIIESIFSIGSKYTTKQIKETLGKLYKENGITKTPKASDLEEFFELKSVKIKNSDGKWEHGFEIINKKGN